MTRDDILRMAREAGWSTFDLIDVERFFKLAYAAGAAAERERIIAANTPEIERINAHIEGMRNRMISEGWRQCAQGQRATQHCAVAEQARLEEREACARMCESVIEEIRETADNVLSHEDCRSIQAAQDCAAAIRARSKE